jgi:hypothetical protein
VTREATSPTALAAAREPLPAIGKEKTVSAPSDAEVIGRSLDEPEAFGLIYDNPEGHRWRFHQWIRAAPRSR